MLLGALLGHLRDSADEEWPRGAASGHAVQLSTAFVDVGLAVGGALVDWWQHHDGSWFWSIALLGWYAHAIGTTAQMSLFAGAARDADAWADWIGFIAGAIATFALAEFFILTAHLWWHGESLGCWNAAVFSGNAFALFVLQISGFAEAADDALTRAQWARQWVGTGGGAGRTTWHEHFVFLALRNFWRVGEEHGGLGSFALMGWHAGAARISQVSFLAEATNNAVLGAEWALDGIGAVGGAS